MKIVLFFIFCSVNVITCGDTILDEVNSFQPNKAPIIESVAIEDFNKQKYILGSPLLPGMIFFITTITEDPEKDDISIEYTADIPGSIDKGSFKNQLQVESSEKITTATTTYSLPDIFDTLGVAISIDIIIKDAKEAKTIKTIELGNIKPAPNISEISVNNTGSPIFVNWKADTDGFFLRYFVADTTIACVINKTKLTFNYSKDQIIVTNETYSVAEKKLCIIIFDSLDQFDFLEYNLP